MRQGIEMESCNYFISSSGIPTHGPSRRRKGGSVRDARRKEPNTTHVLIIGLVALSVLVGGCSTQKIYRPTEYVISEDRIARFPIGAPVRIIGEPSPTDNQMVELGEISLDTYVTNYNDVTTVLVAQLTKEMAKRGQPVTDSASKTIRLRMLKLGGIVSPMATNIDGSMMLRLQLGASQPKVYFIYNTAPAGWTAENGTYRALNGTIARAVMRILSDPSVLAFIGDMPESNPAK